MVNVACGSLVVWSCLRQFGPLVIEFGPLVEHPVWSSILFGRVVVWSAGAMFDYQRWAQRPAGFRVAMALEQIEGVPLPAASLRIAMMTVATMLRTTMLQAMKCASRILEKMQMRVLLRRILKWAGSAGRFCCESIATNAMPKSSTFCDFDHKNYRNRETGTSAR